jgi:hypothetical protein
MAGPARAMPDESAGGDYAERGALVPGFAPAPPVSHR